MSDEVVVAKLLRELERKAERGELLYIGESLARLDSLEKVLGRPVYTGDMLPDETVYVKVVHSRLPHARIRSIDVSGAMEYPNVLAVLTHADVPGENISSALIPDRQLLAYDEVRSVGDIVAAVVAEDVRHAEDGAERVGVEYDPLPAVFDPLEALKPGAPRVHEHGNLVKHMKVRKGDVVRGFEEADVVVEGTYRTQFQDPVPPEPMIGLAMPGGDGSLTLIGSLQSPHVVRDCVARILGFHRDDVRVVQAVTGGAFGTKSDEMPVDVLSLAALASIKTGRPAVCSWDRREMMIMETKRHPSVIYHKTGIKRDGHLTAAETRVYMDTGAYASLGVLVIMRATFHATGAYDIPNVKTDGYLIYTNNTPAGSQRGFGAPQVIFAAEAHIDDIARRMGMDPIELRLKNMLRPGGMTSTGQLMDESCGLPDCVDAVVKASRRGRGRFDHGSGRYRRGMGMAILYHGNSLGPEGSDYAVVDMRINRDGRIVLGTGLTEFGTGSLTGVAQVAASVLGVPLNYFSIERPDTGKHKPTGPTVASRVVTIGGRAAYEAAKRLRARLDLVVADVLGCKLEDVAIVDGMAFCKGGERTMEWADLVEAAYERGVKMDEEGRYVVPECKWDDETGQGMPYRQYTFGAAIAEVEVDVETGRYRVTDFYAAYDVGKAINPAGVMGQIEGGTVQGLGYAMMEELVHVNGRVMNPSLADYYIPTAMDIPERMHMFIVEKPGVLGPFGAKIIAEPPAVLPAPAIRNAILDALGIGVNDLPITPEKVLMKLLKKSS